MKAHTFNRLDFPGVNVGERSWTLKDCALAMVKGEKSGDQLIAEIDAKPYNPVAESGSAAAVKLAEVTEDLRRFGQRLRFFRP